MSDHLSAQCSTLVLTETAGSLHAPGLLEQAMARLGRQWQHARYDLLTVPDIEAIYALTSDSYKVRERVFADIKIAHKLHGAERVVVAVNGNPVADRRIAEFADYYDANVTVQGCNLAMFIPHPAPVSSELAVVCMDWRQHGEAGGLIRTLSDAFGPADREILSLAGGAKDLGTDTPAGHLVLSQIRAVRDRCPDIRRIRLTLHTDCGKYGGRAAFDSDGAQHARLRADLAAAALNVGRRTSCVVSAAIVFVDNTKVVSIDRLDDI